MERLFLGCNFTRLDGDSNVGSDINKSDIHFNTKMKIITHVTQVGTYIMLFMSNIKSCKVSNTEILTTYVTDL